ncbi:MAG TPA: 50S ribosomal protein L44e [Candidatus Nanoarchaeia archaeon]|nr:50S ribosomal protein L44e [Candidatus Nanoarchaeia archaeon]
MKMPKTKKRYCPYCKKHTEHAVSQNKKRASSSMTHGAKQRMWKRGRGTGHGNLGKLSKGALTKWKRYGKKSTKKTDLRFQCKVCKKSSQQRKGFRAKRVEFK